jgi:hypothetical protein
MAKCGSEHLSFQLQTEESQSRLAWVEIQDSIQKLTKAKNAEDVAQVAECLPSMHKALSSTTNAAQKKKKKIRSLTLTAELIV